MSQTAPVQTGRSVEPWTVILPIRHPRSGKSRLSLGAVINTAIAMDVIEAVHRAQLVGTVMIVSDDPSWYSASGTHTLRQHSAGLNGAIEDALHMLGDRTNVAVLVADIPALTPVVLDEALSLAGQVGLGFVPDRSGSGTVLLTAARARDHRPHFGENSADAHRSLGYRQISISESSSLRLDVDVPSDLMDALSAGLCANTRAAMPPVSISQKALR